VLNSSLLFLKKKHQLVVLLKSGTFQPPVTNPLETCQSSSGQIYPHDPCTVIAIQLYWGSGHPLIPLPSDPQDDQKFNKSSNQHFLQMNITSQKSRWAFFCCPTTHLNRGVVSSSTTLDLQVALFFLAFLAARDHNSSFRSIPSHIPTNSNNGRWMAITGIVIHSDTQGLGLAQFMISVVAKVCHHLGYVGIALQLRARYVLCLDSRRCRTLLGGGQEGPLRFVCPSPRIWFTNNFMFIFSKYISLS
jgi:hypothetical protein